MANKFKSIKTMVNDINNPDAEGGPLCLPNIQRKFVWKESQIESLFDSIMRKYPIPSMLVWKTKDKTVKNRNFILNNNDKIVLSTLYNPPTDTTKRLVLDGQQRLQSLYIALKGSNDNKILHFDLLSGLNPNKEESTDEIRYRFEFRKSNDAKFPWFPFNTIVYKDRATIKRMINEFTQDKNLSKDESDLIDENVDIARDEFSKDSNIIYSEIDCTEDDNTISYDDVVEIFIRANNGGTKLSKSDLMFSLMISDWADADIKMDEFLDSINNEFEFERDFILKTAMVLLDEGAKYDVKKLRNDDIKNQIRIQWENITNTIKQIKDYIISNTYIRTNKALSSQLALIPLIYFKYHFPDKWEATPQKQNYVLRILLTSAFSGRPDALIDKIINKIKSTSEFNVNEIYEVIKSDGRQVSLSSEDLFNMGYGSQNIHLIFNLWYPQEEANYQNTYQANNIEVDHIFPQSALRKLNKPKSEIDQLANCMLLTRINNGPENKTNKLPEEWFMDKSDKYLDLHCIPKNSNLWKLEAFDLFIEERKKLISSKFSYLIYNSEGN